MKRMVLAAVVLLMTVVGMAQQQSGLVVDAFLRKAAGTTMRAQFTLAIVDDPTHPEQYAGKLTMHGEKFYIAMLGTEASYDGKTLYTYSQESKEMVLTAPTDNELLDSNPLLFAKALRGVCKVAEKKQGNRTVITLTPKDQSKGVQTVVLVVETGTLLPVSVEVREGKQSTRITFTGARYCKDTPDFAIKRKGAVVNDLR